MADRATLGDRAGMTLHATPTGPVVCGIDHADGHHVAAVAATLARALDVPLVVLHAVPAATPDALPLAKRSLEARARERAREEGQELLDALAAALDGADARFELAEGAPWHALVSRAEEERAAALVVGTAARGRLADLVLGSVSAGVVAEASRPVVVVPPGSPEELPRAATVVVGVDGSPEADQGVRGAAALAAGLGGDLVLTYVVEDTGLGSRRIAGAAGALDDDATPPAAAHALRRAVAHVDHDLPLTTRVRRGAVIDELLAECEEQGAAVLAVGSRGRGPATGALLGSVARETVRRAHLPVLVTAA